MDGVKLILTLLFRLVTMILSIPLTILMIMDPQMGTMLEVKDINKKL